MQPSRDEFRSLARSYTVVPVWRELVADLLRAEPDFLTHHFAQPPLRADLDRLATDPPTRRVGYLDVLDARLREALASAAPDGTLSVIVEPVLRVDARALDAALGGSEPADRRATGAAALRATLSRAAGELSDPNRLAR